MATPPPFTYMMAPPFPGFGQASSSSEFGIKIVIITIIIIVGILIITSLSQVTPKASVAAVAAVPAVAATAAVPAVAATAAVPVAAAVPAAVAAAPVSTFNGLILIKNKCLDGGLATPYLSSSCDPNNGWQKWDLTGGLLKVENKCIDTKETKWYMKDCDASSSSQNKFKIQNNILQFGDGECLDLGNENSHWGCSTTNINQTFVKGTTETIAAAAQAAQAQTVAAQAVTAAPVAAPVAASTEVSTASSGGLLKGIGGTCIQNSDCAGYINDWPDPGTSCDQNRCAQKKKDFANAYYPPSVCKGSLWSSAGTC